MRKLIKKVELRFFQDDANGEYGVTHKDTLDTNNGEGFNAFWDGMGLFHDLLEHAHEHTDKHFRGEYAMNVGGEMAAMGAMWYYVDELGLHSRLSSNSIYSPGDRMRQTTEGLIEEAIVNGYANFGRELLSDVPPQTETDNSELECQLQLFCEKVKGFQTKTDYPDERRDAETYKASVTDEKILNLHRYGFRMAQKLVPNCWENRTTLYQFIEYWNKFCKTHNAEDLANSFRGIDFSLYRDGNLIQWKAVFVPMYGTSPEDYYEHPTTIKSWEQAEVYA